MDEQKRKLEWDQKYSVDVVKIDEQHKRLFATINELIDAIDSHSTKEHIDAIIDALLQYKKFHFTTEEAYFREFQFAGAEEHVAQHAIFSKKLDEMRKECCEDTLTFSFRLIDFLEDWLIGHLMTKDQEYKACFKEHGLK